MIIIIIIIITTPNADFLCATFSFIVFLSKNRFIDREDFPKNDLLIRQSNINETE